ncbi:Fmp41p [Sugiyamaella lignohabitans]|uniref:Fmp41p n=1 Tax=Sugiyamaella lignohabitans TaxID=796027 RepID=A0A167EZ13_9ASCO|nr:Fmp41p [Sugiyamaella lignohabitans]ANB14626.1 Fmp41p [Sugiyamaella lignohabitans]
MVAWKRLIRFVATDGKVYRGEPIISENQDLGKLAEDGTKLSAKLIKGDDIFSEDTVVTNEVLEVSKLLGPLAPTDVPIVKCVGLNYMKHIQEGGRTPPPYPSIFYKPNFAVADHGEDIPIPKISQENQLDYEGELCVVIGKTGKDIKEEDALSYVAGYTAGNDVSARTWQRDPKYAGGVPQWGFSKSFDKYAPLGPVLVSTSEIQNPGTLELKTLVNGEVRQHTNTDDLLFNVAKIIAFISQGTTLEKGTVIMTGTPSGVAMGMKPTPKYLHANDVVEVYISSIGTLKNKMHFI